MGFFGDLMRDLRTNCRAKGGYHDIDDREKIVGEYKITYGVCKRCGHFVHYNKEIMCDHEWGDPRINTAYQSNIQRNRYGYYILETEFKERECEKCETVDAEEHGKNKVYFQIRERVPQ